MMLQKKITSIFLVLCIVGNTVQADDVDKTSWAQQKMNDVRDKAHSAFIIACEKTRAWYEKAKENKRLIASLIVGGCALGLLHVIRVNNAVDQVTRNMQQQLNDAHQNALNVQQEIDRLLQELEKSPNDFLPTNNDNVTRGKLQQVYLEVKRSFIESQEKLKRLNKRADNAEELNNEWAKLYQDRLDVANYDLKVANQEKQNLQQQLNEAQQQIQELTVRIVTLEDQLQEEQNKCQKMVDTATKEMETYAGFVEWASERRKKAQKEIATKKIIENEDI